MESWSRVSIIQVNQDMPAPPMSASKTSLIFRLKVDSIGVRLGSKAKPININTVETTSTLNCVRAKSGAENPTKVKAVTKPITPVTTTDCNRL